MLDPNIPIHCKEADKMRSDMQVPAITHYIISCSCGNMLKQCDCNNLECSKETTIINNACHLCHKSTVSLKPEKYNGWWVYKLRIPSQSLSPEQGEGFKEFYLRQDDVEALEVFINRILHSDD